MNLCRLTLYAIFRVVHSKSTQDPQLRGISPGTTVRFKPLQAMMDRSNRAVLLDTQDLSNRERGNSNERARCHDPCSEPSVLLNQVSLDLISRANSFRGDNTRLQLPGTLCYLLLFFSAIRNGSSVHKLWNRIPPKYAWIHCR